MPVIRGFDNNSGIYSEAAATSKNTKDQNKIPRKISTKLDILDQKIDGLYKDIYISRPDDDHSLNDLLNRIDSAIDNLQSDELNVAGMSELLRRLDKRNSISTENLFKSVEIYLRFCSLIASRWISSMSSTLTVSINFSNFSMFPSIT